MMYELTPRVDDVVELLDELSELNLHPGDRGRVCGFTASPLPMYEVEFRTAEEPEYRVRVMVMAEHIQVVPAAGPLM